MLIGLIELHRVLGGQDKHFHALRLDEVDGSSPSSLLSVVLTCVGYFSAVAPPPAIARTDGNHAPVISDVHVLNLTFGPAQAETYSDNAVRPLR